MFRLSDRKVGLTLVLATLFVMAIAYQAQAYSAEGPAPFGYTGRIVSLDAEHGFLAVQAGPNDELSFRLGNDAAVMTCDMDQRFSDLRIGDEITVAYFEDSAVGYIATEIESWPMGVNRC